MASICYSLSLPPIPKPPNSKIIRPFPTHLSNPNPCPSSIPTFRSFRTRANKLEEEAQKPNEISMSIDNIHSFFDLNVGKWNGSFFVSLCSIAFDVLYFLRLSSLFAGWENEGREKEFWVLCLMLYFGSRWGVLCRNMFSLSVFYCHAPKKVFCWFSGAMDRWKMRV